MVFSERYDFHYCDHVINELIKKGIDQQAARRNQALNDIRMF